MGDRGFKSHPRNQFCGAAPPISLHVYRVYVIQNPAGRFYIGMSEDVTTRVAQHNAEVSQWTKYRGPWMLRWTSEAMSITDARKLENELKRQKGGDGFFLLTGLPRSPGS